MSRPQKATVDYFPHDTHQGGKTIPILEGRYGNDGYTAWFKLLEVLGKSENHFFDCREEIEWEYLITRLRFPADKAKEFFDLLAKLEAIDKQLWKKKVIYSKNFVNGLSEVYRRRRIPLPTKKIVQGILSTKDRVNDDTNELNDDINPQRRVEESRVEKRRVEYIIGELNSKAGTNFKTNSAKTKGHINARFKEGFTLEDFSKVITVKTEQWLNDEKMCRFLRPETLFGTKFESYLNEYRPPSITTDAKRSKENIRKQLES